MKEDMFLDRFVRFNKLVISTTFVLIFGCGDGSSANESNLSPTNRLSSITKDAITWTFATAYEVGQFVNGDYFVVDPGSSVTITSVSPAPIGFSSNFRNGSVVNPSGNVQGYDGRIRNYDSAESVTSPLSLNAGESLVSTVSQTGGGTDVTGNVFSSEHAYLADASVLTIVSAIPAADSFRPPFVGDTKPTYHASTINMALLPEHSIDSKPSITYLNEIADQFSRPWLDHKTGWTGRMMHPINNMANYGRDIGDSTSIMSALLMLDYTTAEKNLPLIRFVQTGIDLYWMSQTGTSWPADGGHMNGRKWPILFAGLMLDESGIKNRVYGTSFGEDDQTYYGVTASLNSAQTNVAYFGKAGSDTYYVNGCAGVGTKDVRPSSLDDDACTDYRNCCTSATWVGTSMSVKIMNQESLWNHAPFFDYVDRWMGYGSDPQVVGGGGTSAPFISDMWNKFRSGL